MKYWIGISENEMLGELGQILYYDIVYNIYHRYNTAIVACTEPRGPWASLFASETLWAAVVYLFIFTKQKMSYKRLINHPKKRTFSSSVVTYGPYYDNVRLLMDARDNRLFKTSCSSTNSLNWKWLWRRYSVLLISRSRI